MIDRDKSTTFDFTKGEQSVTGQSKKVTLERTIPKDGFLNCFANDVPFRYGNNSGWLRLKITRIAEKTPTFNNLEVNAGKEVS